MSDDRDYPLLGQASLSAYLHRLGIERPARLDLAGLATLQAAHLQTVPFHNLTLLAAAGRDPGLPSIAAAVEGALRGHGGTCHVLSPPFVVLLRSLGFDAHLAAATVGAPGDHLVVIVHLAGRRWLCDVANGHPYLRPFPVDADAETDRAQLEQAAYGWHFRLETGPAEPGPRVLRLLPDGTWKKVYTLDPRPVSYASFAQIIREHHMRVGFGPFLTGLRAVRMTTERLLCLRDSWLERYGVGPVGRRHIPNVAAVGAVLTRLFELGELPWEAALRTLEPQTRSWWPKSAAADPAASRQYTASIEVRDQPTVRILVSVGLTDRHSCLYALGQSLLRNGMGSQQGAPNVGILAFENGRNPECIRDNLAAAAALTDAGLPTRIGDPTVVGDVRRRLSSSGLCTEGPSDARVSIATSRMIQVGLLASFFRAPYVPPMPHPVDGRGPLAVWMLDDDLRLERLELNGQRLCCVPLLDLGTELNRLYREHPEASVLVGGNTGCPPLPGFCTLHAQTLDLVAHIAAASQKEPDEVYLAQPNPRHLPDYYYDTTEHGDTHLHSAFAWEADAASDSLTVRAALLAHLRAFLGLGYGQPATRLLVHQPDLPMEPTTARGGNTLFFDLDALFAAPYLSVQIDNQIVSRRGDTVWAHLAAAVPGVSIYRAPFPVHHVRRPDDGSGPSLTDRQALYRMRQFILSQACGTVLSRLVAAHLEGRVLDPLSLLRQRMQKIQIAFANAAALIDRFEDGRYLGRAELWWSAPAESAVREQLELVTQLLQELRGGLLSYVPTEQELELAAERLGAAVTDLRETQTRWRSLWQ